MGGDGGTHRGGRADPCGLSTEDPYQTASIPLDKPYDGCPVENTLSKFRVWTIAHMRISQIRGYLSGLP